MFWYWWLWVIILPADIILDIVSCVKFYQFCLVRNIINYLNERFDIIQDKRNYAVLGIDRPDYLNKTGPVSCVYWIASLGKLWGIFRVYNIKIFWLTCSAFLLLPQALCALFVIVFSIKNRKGCGDILVPLFLALFYPLYVPAESIYHAARELFWGEDREENLNAMKGMKMFEHLG